MKISLNWIKEFTDIKLDVDELIAKIGAQLGEVEEVVNLGERYEGIVVAKIVSCEKHPNADKLNVCLIDDGKVVRGLERDSRGLVQVVCGAPNVRKGLMVAWIPPGVIVPSSFNGEPFTLGVREIRGVTSNGMLASGKELAINEDHEGILVIDKTCQPGDQLAKVYELDDFIISIENKMFTHRPDCFGQLGVAREIAGIQGLQFTSPEWYVTVLDDLRVRANTTLKLTVENTLPELVPRFIAVPMSGISVTKSPLMMQSFLSRIGIKPINNIVDITNFVMSLTAQPMHAYDYDKLARLDNSDTATIIVRKPKHGETITLLGGKTIEPQPDSIMIASAKKPIGIGGIMGGAETEVDVSTKNVVLECATFDMYSIRRTSMTHGLFTEAVTRFNKGQSSHVQDKVLAYGVAWVKKLAGGVVAGEVYDSQHHVSKAQPITLSSNFINDRLGSKLSSSHIKRLLGNVEFLVECKADTLLITVPFWRTDIQIAEDIVEEVGRLYGYDNLPITLPLRSIDPPAVNHLLVTKGKIRAILRSAGANEVLTYSFVHSNLFKAVGQDERLAYKLSNALSPDLQYYRLSLLPSLLEKVHPNIKAGYNEFALYEINKTHDKNSIHEDGLPIEAERLALVFAADNKAAHAYGGSAYYQVRYYLDFLLAQCGLLGSSYIPVTSHTAKTDSIKQCLAPFDKNRSAYVTNQKGVVLGIVGEVNTSTKRALKLPEFVAGFELDIELLKNYAKSVLYRPISKFPHTFQDITFEIQDSISYSRLTLVIDKLLADLRKQHGYNVDYTVLDIFSPSKHVKRVTFRLTFVHPNKTLVTAEVSGALDMLTKGVKAVLQAQRI